MYRLGKKRRMTKVDRLLAVPPKKGHIATVMTDARLDLTLPGIGELCCGARRNKDAPVTSVEAYMLVAVRVRALR